MKGIGRTLSGPLLVSGIATAITFLAGPIRLKILTNTITKDEYGVFGVLDISITIAALLLSLGLGNYIKAKIPGSDEGERKSIYLSALSLLFAISVPLAILIGLAAYVSGVGLFFKTGFDVIVLCIVASLATSFFFIVNGVHFALNKIVSAWSGLVARSVLWLIIYSFLVFYSGYEPSLWLVCFSMALAMMAIFFVSMIKTPIPLKINKLPSSTELRKAMTFSMPLIPSLLQGHGYTLALRYLLLFTYVPLGAVADFVLAGRVMDMVYILGGNLYMTLHVRLFQGWNERAGRYERFAFAKGWIEDKSRVILAGLIGFIIIVVGLREPLIEFLAKGDYLEAAPLIAVMSLLPVARYACMALNDLFIVQERTKTVSAVFLFSFIVLVIAGFPWIKSGGITAAAFLSVAVYLFHAFMLFFLLPSELRPSLKAVIPLKFIVSVVISIIVMFYIEHLAEPFVSTAVSAVLFAILVFTFRVVTLKDVKEFV